jgi:hypothetical protein
MRLKVLSLGFSKTMEIGASGLLFQLAVAVVVVMTNYLTVKKN